MVAADADEWAGGGKVIMVKKRIDKKEMHVGGNLTGDSILGNGNVIHKPTINNNLDSEELGQSIGEVISARERQARREESYREMNNDFSRPIMETVFVSALSGIAIGGFWNIAFPFNVESVPFFVIMIIVVFNILRLTNFGLRHSFFKVFLLSTAFVILLKQTTLIQDWMSINQFTATAILATIGACIGLAVGVIQLFWHPFED